MGKLRRQIRVKEKGIEMGEEMNGWEKLWWDENEAMVNIGVMC